MATLKKFSNVFLAGILATTTAMADAATREEMQQIDAAYPPGSVVVCRSDIPGDGKFSYPTTMLTRGKVISAGQDRVTYDVSITWHTKNTPARADTDLTLTFRMQQRSDEKGQYTLIDTDSMAVSMPAAGAAGEAVTLDGFRRRFGGKENFTPYSQFEITTFPAYITHNPGEAPLYCHKETEM
ncbi:hypothetical protein GZD23_004037 [Salmonella enterica subsp. enterica]|nr:hypothetical protein [Salmonella enterica subsp. enterica serovar Okatie]EBI7260565.1 hypothetical protein [Salmonella enterica]EBY2986102.1 hypothetical protein [Salmonella enterica subsp. enterica serovar Durban]ECC9158750.1 hypothetical protein [Salmonella enterica subsp. salamae]ECV3919479.1 hypothetical protein [Salmonella enterica subsp. enterica serovar O rough]EEG3130292.1 hypothetical protein [Salmonella enterica subsp. enterica serovar Nima]